MTIAEIVEREYVEMGEYEKINFGIKNGPDFSLIAQSLLQTKAFKGLSQAVTMMGALNTLLLKPKNGEKPSEDEIRSFLDYSPCRGLVADIFYLGFKVGKAHAEIEQLERLK